ncbi:MAG: carbamate kinase [Candidatus Marinimicrobia bacterium]|nr:carbamate kinase [Candidatus Neomarinimicrobiota bacterium]
MSIYKKTVIVALGGNALSPKNEAGTIQDQFRHTRESLEAVLHFVDRGYNICITHGNGPQVGAELIRNEISADITPPLPLGVLVANTQGAVGYMIQQSLQNALYKAGSDREVVTFITQVNVDRDDPAIQDPSKFIGRSLTEKQATDFHDKYGWDVKEQERGVWRRVVPSPVSKYIYNGLSIKHLVDFGTIVVAAGGGGIPTYLKEDGSLEGLNGVVDKDLSASLLGRVIKADEMFIVTDVDQIYLDFKKPTQRPILKATSSEITSYLEAGHFYRGSMEPKIKSALYFLKYHGKKVVITSISSLFDAIEGNAGSTITNN